MYFILDANKRVVPVNVETWAKWYETADRKVALDMVGEYRVSTVFLGLGGMSQMFETMIFGPDDYQDLYGSRSSSYEDAKREHATAVEWASPQLHPRLKRMMYHLIPRQPDYIYVRVHRETSEYLSAIGNWVSPLSLARTFTREQVLDYIQSSGGEGYDSQGKWLPIGKRFYMEDEKDGQATMETYDNRD